MAVIKGGFEIVKRAMLKELMKRGDDGIMLTLPKNEIVDLNTRITMDRLIKAGIDPESLTSPDQVLNVLENINNQIMKNARVISADSAEGKTITDKLFGKKGDVVDMTGKKMDTSQGIMGGKSVKELMESGQVQKGTDDIKISEKITDRDMFKNSSLNKKDSVTETISYIKTLEPMDAMKEANSVIGRKGKYKNLTPEESKKILQDTEDHIFERDIPDEDFAKGGRAGYKLGDIVKENIPPEYRLYLKSILPGGEEGKVDESYFTKKFKKELRSQALDKFLRTGKTRGTVHEGDQHRGDPTINKLLEFPSTYAALGTYTYDIDPKTMNVKIKDKYDWNPAYGSKTIRGKTRTGYVGDKEGTDVGLGMFKDKFKESIRDKSVDTANVLEMVGNYFGGKQSEGKGFDVDIDIPMEEATTATEGSFAKGGRAGLYTGGMVDVEPNLSDIGHGSDALMARTRLVSPDGQATTSTGLNYLLAEDNDNIRVPFENGGDFKQFQKEKMMQLMQEYQQYLKNREIEKKQRPYMEKRMGTGPGPILEAAEGGRIGFAGGGGMSKRAFLKLIASLGGTAAAFKSGILGLGEGTTKKAISETVKQAAGSGGQVPPYFLNLVKKIKTMGDDVTEVLAYKDKQKVTKYKDYELTEDLTTGEQTIQRMKVLDDGSEAYYGQPLTEETYMSYKPGKGQVDELTKVKLHQMITKKAQLY